MLTCASIRCRESLPDVTCLSRPSFVRDWCQQRAFHPNRTLGQNFLVDSHILEALLAGAELAPGRHVLEVGPGLGVVTEALLACGARVTAVEKDGRLAAWLRESLGDRPDLALRVADMLDCDLAALPGAPFDALVSNLPYASGTRILIDVGLHAQAPPLLAVTLQREVAERLAAPPGGATRGLGGVWLQQRYDVSLLRIIKPTCFWPRPEVSSAIVRLKRHARLSLDAEAAARFHALSRQAFLHRRKQLAASLRQAPPPLALDAAATQAVLLASGIDPLARPATITNEEWHRLALAWPRPAPPRSPRYDPET